MASESCNSININFLTLQLLTKQMTDITLLKCPNIDIFYSTQGKVSYGTIEEGEAGYFVIRGTSFNQDKARIITTNVPVTEGKDVTLNCTSDDEWTREDRQPAVTNRRILTKDNYLKITDSSIADAGVYECQNGPTLYRFFVQVKVFVKVEIVLTVLNYVYTPQLKNKTSDIYKATENNFTTEMDKLYNGTPGYVRTEVLNFTKGSVKVDFRVIIVIVATDPKNESTIPDTKAETSHRIVKAAKTGSVKQLVVDKEVVVKSPPLEPGNVKIFGIESDELSIRWDASQDADTYNVLGYYVQHREFEVKEYKNAPIPATEKEITYSYTIQDLEPEKIYMIRVGAWNKYGSNYNDETGHETLAAPFAKWIIVLIVLAILFVLGIIVGFIAYKRRKAEQRRKRLEAEEDARFGGLVGDARLHSTSHYEDRNVKGLKYSYTNDSFKPSEVNWYEIPYEKLTLMNELGSGAFGVVYKGDLKRENGDVTTCAIKSLKASATVEEIRDLYNELEIMTNVGYHPNLVNLIGACTQDGHLLVVLEIAENGNLLELLKKSREANQNYENINSGGLTEEMKTGIAIDVARGMAHLTNCRCIHRDLAARNVLLDENYVAKVSDYGMARDVYEQLMYKKETQGKLPVKWMAIESLETYTFTIESDIWSYGVLLWEIESKGLKPYAGMNTTELMAELKRGYRLEKPIGCSDAMYQIMRDCWNRNPTARPSFDQLVAQLESMELFA